MANRRIFYSCESIGMAPFFSAPTVYKTLRGIQSASNNVNLNLEQFFELGQLSVYAQIETLPDVEVTVEKVLDGYCPVYLAATQDAVAKTLVGRSNQRVNVAMSFHNDTNNTASGNEISQVINSGMYVSQVSYDVSVQGAAKESVTLVGNDRVWATGSYTYTGWTAGNGVLSPSPSAIEGIDLRQHLVMASSTFPLGIQGISSSGTNDPVGTSGFAVHMQSFKASANLGRENMLELGRRGPYFRYVAFPCEVNTSIEVLATNGDMFSATEDGLLSNGQNTVDETIKIYMKEGLILDMGTKNRLSSVNFNSGGASKGGGNATITYSFICWNDFSCSHPADYTSGLYP